jgi:hypothetical protein
MKSFVRHAYTRQWWAMGCFSLPPTTSKNKNIHQLHLRGIAAVVIRVTCFIPVPDSTLYVHACHPRGALPAPGLAGCPTGRGE